MATASRGLAAGARPDHQDSRMIGEEIIQDGVDDPRQIVRDGRDGTPVVVG
jgi:hypothetical protein